MSLLTRVAAAEKCLVAWCPEERVRDALYCGSAGRGHLGDNFAGRIRVLADGTAVLTAGPQSREPEWLRRRRTVGLPAKEMTLA